MGVTQYIGARYMPIFADPPEHSSAKTYEPLTIVLHEGNSYTSKQFVPKGIQITNETYWAETGNYNAQVEAYRRETMQAYELAQGTQNDIDTLLPKADFSAQNTVKSYIDAFATYCTPEQYGAVGDGITDDTNSFNNAIQSGQPIIATKTYKVSGLILDAFIYGFSSGQLISDTPFIINEHTQLYDLKIKSTGHDVLYFDTTNYETNTTVTDTIISNCVIDVPSNGNAIHIHLYNGKGIVGPKIIDTTAASDGVLNSFIYFSTYQDAPSRPWVTGCYIERSGTYSNAKYFLYVQDAIEIDADYSEALLSLNIVDCFYQCTSNTQYFMRVRGVRNTRLIRPRIFDSAQKELIYFANTNNSLYFDFLPTDTDFDNIGAGAEGWENCFYSLTNYLQYNYMLVSSPFNNNRYDSVKLIEPSMMPKHVTNKKGFFMPQDDNDPNDSRGYFHLYITPQNHLFYDTKTTTGELQTGEIYTSRFPFAGTTANRPATPQNGMMYFDTTLRKPVWYDTGTSQWRDATGTIA